MSLSKARLALLQRLQRRHQREREARFVVEGVRGARAALQSGARVRFAVTSPRLEDLDPGGEIPLLLGAAGVEVTNVGDTELAGLAGTVSPQGVLLVCEEPQASLETLGAIIAATPAGLLIADAIQDPANLGTMIRTAAALGLAGVIALDGSVDPWNAKVVRGTAGACFHVPIVRARCAATLAWLAEQGIRLLGAAASGADVRTVGGPTANGHREPAAPGTGRPWALAIGNEGAGLRDEVRAAADELIGVPIRGDVDSLNAATAAAILLWELIRARISAP